MIPVAFNYATPSVFESGRQQATLGLSADVARPVRLHARVARDVLSVRLALSTLGELVWSSDEWVAAGDLVGLLDPVVTVHPDRVFFEAFSQDQSAYGLVVLDRAMLEAAGEVACGTTNVDFTAWLWAALAELRSSRETWLRIGPEGFEVKTVGAGGRFEAKVELPEPWVRGFLQLSGAMALPGTRLPVRPVDLLAAIRFLRHTKARVSPRALRWELEPGTDAALVLEPWEQRYALVGASHGATERRVVRTWGRRRLKLLEPLLPYADRVDVYLKGRALPVFYAVKLPGVTFVLGLSGWSAQRWTESASFDLLVPPSSDPALEGRVLEGLRSAFLCRTDELARSLGVTAAAASAALAGLAAAGRAVYDVEARAYRWRELFATPPDPARLYPPDARREQCARFLAEGRVTVTSLEARETRKQLRLRAPGGPTFREVVLRDWVARGGAGGEPAVEVVLSDEDRVIFARCGCAFFHENLLNRGPCEHVLALAHVARERRREEASSTPIDVDAFRAARGAHASQPFGGAEDDDAGDGGAGRDDEGHDG